MRKTLFQIIEPHQQESFIEEAYDIFMILTMCSGSSLPIINYRKDGFLSSSILLLS